MAHVSCTEADQTCYFAVLKRTDGWAHGRERENRERKTGDGAMALDSTPVANRGAGGSGNDRMHRYNHKEDMGGGVTSEDAQR